MIPQEDKLINLAIHESSDPDMLKREAQSKMGSRPDTESPDSEMLRGDTDSKILDDLNYENEEDREAPLERDFDSLREDRVADSQIQIAD